MPPLPDTAVCLHCGYSLRGLPENACPECGKAFDPANPATWRDTSSLRPVWLWRHWAGRLPLWHKLLTVVATLILLNVISCLPYRDVDGLQLLLLIIGPSLLLGLLLSYCLRARANRVCRLAEETRGSRSRTIRVCVSLLMVALVLAPSAVPMSIRVTLSMPILEYKAYRIRQAGHSDNKPQIAGLFFVERVGLLGGGEIKLVLTDGRSGQAVVYRPWAAGLGPNTQTGLTRWRWMTW